MALGFTSQPLDVSTMSRVHLELMVSELTKANSELFAENEELKANNKVLLDQWREVVAKSLGRTA